jgi:hypothetical protein
MQSKRKVTIWLDNHQINALKSGIPMSVLIRLGVDWTIKKHSKRGIDVDRQASLTTYDSDESINSAYFSSFDQISPFTLSRSVSFFGGFGGDLRISIRFLHSSSG